MAKEKEQYWIAYFTKIDGEKVDVKRPFICSRKTMDFILDMVGENAALRARKVELELDKKTGLYMAGREKR